jgi:hypothetical protein
LAELLIEYKHGVVNNDQCVKWNKDND